MCISLHVTMVYMATWLHVCCSAVGSSYKINACRHTSHSYASPISTTKQHFVCWCSGGLWFLLCLSFCFIFFVLGFSIISFASLVWTSYTITPSVRAYITQHFGFISMHCNAVGISPKTQGRTYHHSKYTQHTTTHHAMIKVKRKTQNATRRMCICLIFRINFMVWSRALVPILWNFRICIAGTSNLFILIGFLCFMKNSPMPRI